MAEALLVVVLENLSSFVRHEFATFWGVNGEIQRLTNSLKLIQAVIVDDEQKEITQEFIKIWLQKLKDAAHVLDDILDEYSIGSLPHNSGYTSQAHRFSLSSIKPNNLRCRYRIGKRLKEITHRLDQIVKERKDYDFVEREVIRERLIQVPEWRQTSSIIAQPQVYGRDGDKDKIVELLLRQTPESGGLSVYPIVGLGGLGKTTLAQLVFNDQRVSEHFTLRIWICVSDDFSVTSILQSMMEFITYEKCDPMDLNAMQRKVQEKLRNQRYLLVLDDVWNRNQDKWNQLRSVLAFGSKGASVLVTTRDLDVASIMGNHPPYHLSLLSEDECWLLFKQRAFIDDKEASPQLEEIGKEIVKKCGGLPLVAKALGSLLHSKSDEKQWLEVKEIELWNLSLENFILSTLRLSYFSLTPALRRCFAFCAIFSKDEIIGKEELIHLWMANGFISSRENLEIEDVGNEIWNELYKNSFFQEVTIDDDGCTKFKMHALIHDLAQSITKKECSVIKGGDITNLPRSTHHIKYVGDGLTFNKKDITNVESLRTFFNMNHGSELDFGKFQVQSLRVLSTNSPKLPSLSYLIHLRYLAIHDLDIDTIPTSICSLRRLEILKFIHCVKLRSLPEGLANLQNLRHLIILRCSALSHMPPSIGKLSGLRTLSLFIVRSEKGHSLKELHGLKLRQRELSIKGLECVGSVDEAKGVNLIGIEELRVLSLSWDNSKEIEMKAVGVDAEQVMEALQPHSNLKKLEVRGYKGSHFPSWMKDVSCINDLVSLKLENCPALKCLPEAIQHLTSLERLYISGCPMLEDRCKEGSGEDWHKIQHIPYISLHEHPTTSSVASSHGSSFSANNVNEFSVFVTEQLDNTSVCSDDDDVRSSLPSRVTSLLGSTCCSPSGRTISSLPGIDDE